MPNAFFLWAVLAVGVTTGALSLWQPSAALGALIGGAWNLAGLWCLSRVLRAWIIPQPSQRRVVAWLAGKIFLYGVLGILLYTRMVPLLGFGIGFTVVLLFAMGWYAASVSRLTPARSHGR